MDQTLSESQAAQFFIYTIVRQVRESWSGVLYQLQQFPSSSSLGLLNEEKAQWEMALAVIALDLGALKNLFPKDQAERLLSLTIEYLPEEQRDYVLASLDEYNNRYDEDVADGLNPVTAIGEILYGRWGLAGTAYTPGELFVAKDQILAGALGVTVSSFLGFWKRNKNDVVATD